MKKWQNTFRVGLIYKCRMTYSQKLGLMCEWDPELPATKGGLNDQEMAQYRAGRDVLLAEVAKEMGGAALVFEV